MNRRSIRYYSMGDLSGYAIAAVGYVRGLVNAGIDVEWVRLKWSGNPSAEGPQIYGNDCPLLTIGGNSPGGGFADVRALIVRTSRPLRCDTMIAHTTPDYWPTLFQREPGLLHVGSTVWETDRPPAYWMSLLDLADRIVVPCRMNRQDFVRAGVRPPVHVVPHVRLHSPDVFATAEVEHVRRQLGIPSDHRVFYCISAWDVRKAIPDLIDAYARAFRAEEPVTLLIKTQRTGFADGPLHERHLTRDMFEAVRQRLSQRDGRPLPRMHLVDGDLDHRSIGALHSLGDCYVSMAHGEGWGLGAFDAAALGKPVIMTGWSAPLDYLAPTTGTWPGATPYRLTAVPVCPAFKPSYFPSQRWAQPDLDAAAALMRRFHEDGDEMRTAARAIRTDIVNRFAEPVVTRHLLDAIHV